MRDAEKPSFSSGKCLSSFSDFPESRDQQAGEGAEMTMSTVADIRPMEGGIIQRNHALSKAVPNWLRSRVPQPVQGGYSPPQLIRDHLQRATYRWAASSWKGNEKEQS
ncbi:hypothetical protein AVEN_115303-1 [Araneus ventricosus]|uniref:Uncharacterized protein n=1 Tax=Araneus ventricosus TaxID=182803 RepID=A0A4Y1ZYK6_ARAVE|nr:hypothetical protein AVEN_115303-1 [Araneus ventricosus]